MKQVIAGDLGGTHCRLVLATVNECDIVIQQHQDYPAQEFENFNSVLTQFLHEHVRNSRVSSACFAVAGPVRNEQVRLTNLPWTLDSRDLARHFDIPEVTLINDFVANGYSLAVLTQRDYTELQTGNSPSGNRVLLGAGTGLGMAQVIGEGNRLQVLASEGGHMDFAPNDTEQVELLGFLHRSLPRVSYEHVLSGQGLVRLYRYFAWRNNADAGAIIDAADPAAEVGRRAVSGEDPLAESALALFFRIYGSCAANLALVGLARGGVYLAGGIAPRLLDALQRSDFIPVFNNKPPMNELLEKMPVKVITNPRAGLLGAAWYAVNR